ncbi:MAG TPA: hypothetical protein VFI72_03700, partial [Candidatus Angelobacter sp.]|nr:hypothetical protein [Candidatus Angelobacter sp.]
SRWLRFFVYVQFVTLFAVVPALFLRLGTRAIWLVVSMLVCLSVCIALEFWHLHKRFYPESREARWQQALTIVLSPLSAIRAMDTVGRDLLAGFHPVTAAAVICEAPEFEAFAGEQLRQRNFGPAAKEWWTQAEQRALRSVVAKRGLKAEQLLTAPARQEGCDVYCPRCLAQYLAAREACSDCGYEGLVAF